MEEKGYENADDHGHADGRVFDADGDDVHHRAGADGEGGGREKGEKQKCADLRAASS